MILSEHQYWSPTHGAEVVRLSTADDLGQEFYAFIEATVGRRARMLRERAAEALSQAIDLGLKPGEVRWRS